MSDVRFICPACDKENEYNEEEPLETLPAVTDCIYCGQDIVILALTGDEADAIIELLKAKAAKKELGRLL